jgi:isocitrate dehydrogenase
LRWDSIGEFAALGASLNHLSTVTGNKKAATLSKALDQAMEKLLDNNQSPSRKVNEIDSRGSHFYVALYWAQALAEQNADAGLKAHFSPIAEKLTASETTITKELLRAQGSPVDLGGYYHPDPVKIAAAMRPSATLNGIIG